MFLLYRFEQCPAVEMRRFGTFFKLFFFHMNVFEKNTIPNSIIFFFYRTLWVFWTTPSFKDLILFLVLRTRQNCIAQN